MNPDTLLNKFFSSNKIIYPRRDWIILLILLLIMIISASIFDYMVYSQISSGEMYVTVSKQELNLENLKTKELKNLMDNLDVKNKTMESLKIGQSIDPSL